ncbi:MAG: ribosomal-protein-alanine N-acetyltransferase [Thermoprotei archaeon]|nr:MAG: ribosomal-protein-alanine N-acetyltransferase [Thermoprotei archaeon]
MGNAPPAALEEVVIRRAAPDDIDGIISVNIECLPEHYPIRFWLEHIERYGDAFYVAEVGSRIIAYVMPRVEFGFAKLGTGMRRLGHIVSIAVRRAFRRRGIATVLMTASMESLKNEYGVQEVYLEVRVSNEPAINLYKKLGFTIVERIRNYYLDGEDAYVMAKEL